MAETSGNLPDAFDRALDQMKVRPDTVSTKAATIRTLPVLAVGGATTYIVQTFRVQEDGARSRDTIFLECYSADGPVRLVLRSEVADVIARQRESLTGKVRSKAARKQAEARKARGERPAFLGRRRHRFFRALFDAIRREAAFQVICAVKEIAPDPEARSIFAGKGLLVTMSMGFSGEYHTFLSLNDRHVYRVALARASWHATRRELQNRGLWPDAMGQGEGGDA